MAATRRITTQISDNVPAVFVTLRGKTYRLPGPLALVQTDIVRREGDHEITHINTLSLDAIAASCPLAHHDDAEDRSGGGLLTRVSRGSVSVRALAVVAVHEALLSGCPPRSPDRGVDDEEGAASERRTLQRAAARLTWGLAGLAYELMHSQAGHWPQLSDPVARQAVAGSLLTQLHGLNPRLSLAVLRAYGQLTPARLQEMLLHGLLPAPKAAADDAGASQPAEERCAPVDTPSHGQQHPLDETVARV